MAQPLTSRIPTTLRIQDVKPYLERGQNTYGKIRIEWTGCNYGGTRPWLCCPRCDRKAAILYQAKAALACRKCFGLVHPSTRETGEQRWRRKCEWFHEKTGQRIPVGFPVKYPPKPWAMRHQTYEGIVDTMRGEELRYLRYRLNKLRFCTDGFERGFGYVEGVCRLVASRPNDSGL